MFDEVVSTRLCLRESAPCPRPEITARTEDVPPQPTVADCPAGSSTVAVIDTDTEPLDEAIERRRKQFREIRPDTATVPGVAVTRACDRVFRGETVSALPQVDELRVRITSLKKKNCVNKIDEIYIHEDPKPSACMEHSESGHTGLEETSSKEQTLQVVFEVTVSDDCSCPLSSSESQVENVHNQIDDGICHAEVTVCDDNDAAHVVHTTNHIERSCLCLAFRDVGCIPRIQNADGDSVLIETYISDRAVISELVDRLKDVTEHVSLQRLTARQEGTVTSTSTTIDLSHLTARQREAATLAVSEGYYETPRQTDLDDLAATLGISKSALSQRLNAAEAKLATAVFDP